MQITLILFLPIGGGMVMIFNINIAVLFVGTFIGKILYFQNYKNLQHK